MGASLLALAKSIYYCARHSRKFRRRHDKFNNVRCRARSESPMYTDKLLIGFLDLVKFSRFKV